MRRVMCCVRVALLVQILSLKKAHHRTVERYISYEGFEKKFSNGLDYIIPTFDDYYTKKLHPKPDSLNKKGKLYMSRNANQVLGDDLKTPVSFILCWTPNGDIVGGTAQAIRIAKLYRIPVFNFATQMNEIKYYFDNFI